jgi:uncharacterized protein (DUF433 family)
MARPRRDTMQFNVRLPKALHGDLAGFVGRAGDSPSAVAVTALREWARMQQYPGIDFRWTPAGRAPCVTGTGLTVWEVHAVWLDHGRNAARIERHYVGLTRSRVSAAVAYARAFADEKPAAAFGERPPFAREVRV